MRFIARTICALALLMVSGPVSFAAGTESLELVVLGSGGPGATGRASSSFLLLLDNVPRVLIDAGSGSFLTLGKAGLSLQATDIVLLTHLHVDHVAELPGLMKARSVSAGAPITFNIWGPGGAPASQGTAFFPSTTRFVQRLFGDHGEFAYLRDFAAPMTLSPHDLAFARDAIQSVYSDHGLVIQAIAGHHGDAPAVIYRVDYRGKSVTFSGDIDAQGLSRLAQIAKDSDLLVFNSVVLDPPGSPEVLYSLHTPPGSIGRVASQAHAHRLLLGHISPAIDHERAAVEASIRVSFPGTVTFAEDGMRLAP